MAHVIKIGTTCSRLAVSAPVLQKPKRRADPLNKLWTKKRIKNAPWFVASIDYQLERLSAFEEYATEREDLAVDEEARSFSLPSVDATDKILRYEAHLDRQLYRAMDQLERLQRQRREKTCRLRSTLIWEEGDKSFCQTKPRSALFSMHVTS